MCGEQGFIAMRETVHLVKFIGKSCSIFFRVLMLRYSTTGYKVLKYSSRIHMVYLAAQQQNKLIQFPVCANIGVLFTLDILSQACEKHIQTRFSLQQFRFWSITQPIMLCHVSVHSGAFCLFKDTELGIRFQQPSLIELLYFLILTIYLSYWTRFCSQQQQCLLYIGIMLKQHFKNTNCEFYEQFSCRKRMFPIQSLGVECKVCLSHAGGLR